MENLIKNYEVRTSVDEYTVRSEEDLRGKVRVADPARAG